MLICSSLIYCTFTIAVHRVTLTARNPPIILLETHKVHNKIDKLGLFRNRLDGGNFPRTDRLDDTNQNRNTGIW